MKGRKVRLGERLLGAGFLSALALGVVLCLLIRGLAGVSLGPARTHGAGRSGRVLGEGTAKARLGSGGEKNDGGRRGEAARDSLVILLDLLLLGVGELVLLDGGVLDGHGSGLRGFGWLLARAIVRRIERGGRTCGNQNAENNAKLRNRNTSLLHQTHRQFLTGSRAIRVGNTHPT